MEQTVFRQWIASAAFALTLFGSSSQAQGVFDLGAISREMTQPAPAAPPPSKAAIDAFSFEVSAPLRQQNVDKFVNMLVSMDPGFASQLQGVDLFG